MKGKGEQAGASNGGQRPSLNSGFQFRRGWPIRSPIMNNRILIACFVALLGAWIALVILGKRMLPSAPIPKAWIVPLGARGWEYVMMGTAKEGMTRDTLTGILGAPNDVTISTMHPGQVYLHYTNPHDSKRDVSFAVSSEQEILYAAPGEPMPASFDLGVVPPKSKDGEQISGGNGGQRR